MGQGYSHPGYLQSTNTFNCNALFVSGVTLPNLPSALFNRPDLTRISTLLCLSRGLQEIPPEISRLQNLQVLDVGHNEISAFPEELCTITSLVTLKLQSNELPSPPIAIGLLTNLTQLHLASNPIHSLPWSLFTLPRLTLLDLSNTMLNHIPSNISLLTTLTNLNISTNPINELPDGLSALVKLEILSISNCRMLRSIPCGLKNLQRLRRLELSHCNILVMPIWFVDLPALTDLSINGNPFMRNRSLSLDVLRRKKHNARSREIMQFLWMVALERHCYRRRIRGELREGASAIRPLNYYSYWARLPREILEMILNLIAPSYTSLVMPTPALMKTFVLFDNSAPMLENAPRLRCNIFDVLAPLVGRCPHGWDELKEFSFTRKEGDTAYDCATLTYRMRVLVDRLADGKVIGEVGDGKPITPACLFASLHAIEQEKLRERRRLRFAAA